MRDRFIYGRYGFLNGEKTILLDADLNLHSNAVFLNRSDLMYVGKLTNVRIFIVIDKTVIHSYSEVLKGNWVEMNESIWFKLLSETLQRKESNDVRSKRLQRGGR